MAGVPKVRDAGQGGDGAATARITIRETPDGLGIYNPARRNMPVVLFLLLWLAGWSAGEYFALAEILSSRNPIAEGFLIFWVTFWTMGGAICWWVVLWNLFGTERVFVTGGALVRSVGVGPLRRRKVYPVGEISNLRSISPAKGGNGTILASAIAFDVDGKTREVGAGMDQDEVEVVLAALRRYLPQTATMTGKTATATG